MTNEAGLEFENIVTDGDLSTALSRPTDADHKAALDAIENLFDYMLRCEIVYDSVRDDVELIRAALSSPAVPVIKFPQQAVDNLTKHQGQLDVDGIMVSVSRQAVDEVLEFVRAYAALQKMQKVDLNGMKFVIPNETTTTYSQKDIEDAKKYNRAIDDIKAKYGELYAVVEK